MRAFAWIGFAGNLLKFGFFRGFFLLDGLLLRRD